jgi:predicted transcriptional regulator
MIPDVPDLLVVAEALKESGLKQTDAARLSGVSRPTVLKLYNGRDLRYSVVRKICKGVDEGLRHKKSGMTVGQICHRELLSVEKDDQVKRAVELMTRHDVDQLPIFDGSDVVGSVEMRELYKWRAEAVDFSEFRQRPVTEVMTRAFIVVDSEDPFVAVRSLLLFRPAILVRTKGRIDGILTWADVVRARGRPRLE